MTAERQENKVYFEIVGKFRASNFLFTFAFPFTPIFRFGVIMVPHFELARPL